MTYPQYGHQWVTRGVSQYPPQFKPQNKCPVRGGRWFVRKKRVAGVNGAWRAWTKGLNRKHSKNFHTFEEAIVWAQEHAGMKP